MKKNERILVLSAFPEKILSTLIKYSEDEFLFKNDLDKEVSSEFIINKEIDKIICFGYGKIIKSSVIEKCDVINLHGGFLPFNKGPNPNLWSWLDDTPKGVTIHYIDKGIDTGDIISQSIIENMNDSLSLHDSFDRILDELTSLFEITWPKIKSGTNKRIPQTNKGTYYTLKDQKPFIHILRKMYDEPIKDMIKEIRSIKTEKN